MTRAELEQYIKERIYPNNAQKITGEALQSVLLEINANKQDQEEGKGLSSNDFTNEDKELVQTISNKVDNTVFDEFKNEYNEAIENKADTDGSYPDMTVGKAEKVAMTFKNNGNIVITNLSGQSKEFMPATPSGDPMHYAYEEEGAVYDATTNKWSLYGIEMTTAEMRTSYVQTKYFAKFMALADYRLAAPKSEIYRSGSFVVNVGAKESSAGSFMYSNIVSWNNTFRNNTKLKAINPLCADPNYPLRVAKMQNAFLGCHYFIKILYLIDVSPLTNASDVNLAFNACYALEDVKLKNLKVSISFKDSPKVSLEMLQYIVENAANTSAITITVHSEVYNKLVDTTNTAWNAVYTLAATKNIAFAIA